MGRPTGQLSVLSVRCKYVICLQLQLETPRKEISNNCTEKERKNERKKERKNFSLVRNVPIQTFPPPPPPPPPTTTTTTLNVSGLSIVVDSCQITSCGLLYDFLLLPQLHPTPPKFPPPRCIMCRSTDICSVLPRPKNELESSHFSL